MSLPSASSTRVKLLNKPGQIPQPSGRAVSHVSASAAAGGDGSQPLPFQTVAAGTGGIFENMLFGIRITTGMYVGRSTRKTTGGAAPPARR